MARVGNSIDAYGVSFTDIGHTGHSNDATHRKTIDRTISRGASLDGRDALERASSRKPSDGRDAR